MTHLFAAAPDLLKDLAIFLPESVAQARLRTQQDLTEIERYEKIVPQAPVDDRRRKRAGYDSTDDEDEDEVLTHRAARVANWIPDEQPYDADDGNILNSQSGMNR